MVHCAFWVWLVCLATSSAFLIPEDMLVPKGVKTSSVVLAIPSATVAISRYARTSENMASKYTFPAFGFLNLWGHPELDMVLLYLPALIGCIFHNLETFVSF